MKSISGWRAGHNEVDRDLGKLGRGALVTLKIPQEAQV